MKSKIITVTLSALLLSVFYSVPAAEARGYSRVAYTSPSSSVRVQAATKVVPPATTSVRAPSAPAKITSTSNMQAIADRAAGLGQPITRNGEAMNTASYGRAIACSSCNNIQSKIVMPLPSTSSFAFVINSASTAPTRTTTTPATRTTTTPATRTPTTPATRTTTTTPATRTTTAPTIIFRVATPALPLSSVNNPNLPVFSGNTNTTASNPGNRVVTPPNNNNNLGDTTSTIPNVVNNSSNPMPQNTTNQPTQNSSSNSQTTLNNSSPNMIPNLAPNSTATNSPTQTSKFKVS